MLRGLPGLPHVNTPALHVQDKDIIGWPDRRCRLKAVQERRLHRYQQMFIPCSESKGKGTCLVKRLGNGSA